MRRLEGSTCWLALVWLFPAILRWAIVDSSTCKGIYDTIYYLSCKMRFTDASSRNFGSQKANCKQLSLLEDIACLDDSRDNLCVRSRVQYQDQALVRGHNFERTCNSANIIIWAVVSRIQPAHIFGSSARSAHNQRCFRGHQRILHPLSAAHLEERRNIFPSSPHLQQCELKDMPSLVVRSVLKSWCLQ